METVSIEYIPTTGEAITVTVREFDSVKRTYEMFPKEIYFGDTVYHVFYDINVSNATIPEFVDTKHMNVSSSSARLTSDTLNSQYAWKGEVSSTVWRDFMSDTRDLIPGEKRAGAKSYFEFPPLEDWDAPFWKEMREKMAPEGMKCELKMTLRLENPEEVHIEISQAILIKPRPENEMALLEKWYKNTPEGLFPKVERTRKVPHNHDLISSGLSDIRIGRNRFDPWMFVRLGNRKPSDPNNPTTLDGWRELEASLIPSTMRDEVRLVRLQLEYYAARAGEDARNARNELTDWLQSLPKPQRVVMAASLMYNSSRFTGTTLHTRNQELIHAIQAMPN